jgi:hypothetical protein
VPSSVVRQKSYNVCSGGIKSVRNEVAFRFGAQDDDGSRHRQRVLGRERKGRDANGSGIRIGSAMTSASWVEEEGRGESFDAVKDRRWSGNSLIKLKGQLQPLRLPDCAQCSAMRTASSGHSHEQLGPARPA